MPMHPARLSYVDADRSDALISGDGTTVIIQHVLTDGKEANFALSIPAAEGLLHRLADLMTVSLGKTTFAGGAGAVRTTPVMSAEAQNDGQGAVILCLLDDANIARYFLLQKKTSSALRVRLRAAESNPSSKTP